MPPPPPFPQNLRNLKFKMHFVLLCVVTAIRPMMTPEQEKNFAIALRDFRPDSQIYPRIATAYMPKWDSFMAQASKSLQARNRGSWTLIQGQPDVHGLQVGWESGF